MPAEPVNALPPPPPGGKTAFIPMSARTVDALKAATRRHRHLNRAQVIANAVEVWLFVTEFQESGGEVYLKRPGTDGLDRVIFSPE